jgi:TRL-like protein family
MSNKSLMFVLPVLFLALQGCATMEPIGVAYTNVQIPVAATANGISPQKTGTAECKSYFALVATGDCSIETAEKNGGITKVNHIDWKADNVLGIVGTYTLTVYGE